MDLDKSVTAEFSEFFPPQCTSTRVPALTSVPAADHTPIPRSTPVPAPVPTAKYVRPTGYDIFAPGGLKGDCDSDPTPRFTSHITDLSKIHSLTRAGTVQGGDLKPHGYLHNQETALEVPVYAPVDSYLITFAYYSDQSAPPIYTFNFQVSCEVAYYFDHLRDVVDKIGEVTPEAPASDSHGTPISPPIFFQAGELIGYASGTSSSRNWDFGVLNTQQWNDLPPEESYVYSPNVEKYRFAVCQYEYFIDGIKEQYMSMLGHQGCDP